MANPITDEDIERITQRAVRLALQQDREERDRQSQLATQAAVAAALANQTSQVQALRRPDLPPFDPKDIEAWIRRIENAYNRSGIVNARDKFSFIEKLFNSKEDARVNSFICGPQTADKWDEFIKYLRERYGRTKQQEVYSLLNGVPRDGRRPSDLNAYLKELTANVTVDDIRKEVLLKEMPAEVKQHLADKIDEMTCDQTAAACDKYFDHSGKLKNKTDTTSVNHVSNLRQPQHHQQQQQQQTQQQPRQTTFTAPFAASEDESDINTVRFRGGQRQSFNVSNRSASRGRSYSNNNNNNNSNNNNNNNSNAQYSSSGANRRGGASSSNSSSNPPNGNKVCRHHIRFGDQAYSCEGSWCAMKDKLAPKGQASR